MVSKFLPLDYFSLIITHHTSFNSCQELCVVGDEMYFEKASFSIELLLSCTNFFSDMQYLDRTGMVETNEVNDIISTWQHQANKYKVFRMNRTDSKQIGKKIHNQ